VDVLLGFGAYAVWSLFHSNSLPSLSLALALLTGAATLFTPYFANQVKTGVSSVLATPTPMQITLVSPSSLARAAATNVSVLGSGFQPGVTAVLNDTAGAPAGTIDGLQVLSPTQLLMRITPQADVAATSATLTILLPSGLSATATIALR
jgi:hypothetical protein